MPHLFARMVQGFKGKSESAFLSIVKLLYSRNLEPSTCGRFVVNGEVAAQDPISANLKKGMNAARIGITSFSGALELVPPSHGSESLRLHHLFSTRGMWKYKALSRRMDSMLHEVQGNNRAR